MLKYISISIILISSLHAELTATFTQNGQIDTRLDRFPALSLPAGKPVTPFLSAGQFKAEWTGNIELKERRRLYFSFEGKGEASLEINGKSVLTEEGIFGEAKSKRIRLNPGSHQLSIKYSSPEDGSGKFRLYWEEKDLPRQTIPSLAFTTKPDANATQGDLARHGRMIFAEQHCAKCHAPESGFGATPMPEVSEIAPVLIGVADRVSEQWLKKWIAHPAKLKPSTHMPQLVNPETDEGLQQVADLTAYFMSSKKPSKTEKPAHDKELIQAGGAHFHELGCIACHSPASGEAVAGRVPLNHVAEKFLPGKLVTFLKNPETYHPFTSMPNFQLSDAEAEAIAAFLETESEGKETKMAYHFPEGNATRGAALAESLQCGTCHPGLPGGVSQAAGLDAIFKLDWTKKGCISEADPRAELPTPNLRERELKALLAFSKTGPHSLKKNNLAEFAKRQVTAKRCTACHSLDAEPSLLDSSHHTTEALAAHLTALNERVDQTRPQLTFIGEMLYTSYIEKVLVGTLETRARPWLGTRMPAFPAHAKSLAEGLSRMHGFAPSAPTPFQADPELSKIGETLIGTEGFGCNTCHGTGQEKPTAAFEVGAINFQLISDRLKAGYYYRWMDHPAAIIPGNKMPKYADGNESQRTDILNGNASKQYQAIWHWLQTQRHPAAKKSGE